MREVGAGAQSGERRRSRTEGVSEIGYEGRGGGLLSACWSCRIGAGSR